MTAQELMALACKAQQRAYAPYSHFCVGAALEAKDGTVFTGCNIENAAFTPTNCAERTAFFTAVAQGVTEFARIAIVGGNPAQEAAFCPPCGVCRQVMREFCDPDSFEILLGVPKQGEAAPAGEKKPSTEQENSHPAAPGNDNFAVRETDRPAGKGQDAAPEYEIRRYLLRELLPEGFGPEQLL